jgi:GxxExxY protein
MREQKMREIPIGEEHDELSSRVIGAAIEVHKELGPGLSEFLYQQALCREMELRNIPFQKQVTFDVLYKGEKIGETRVDLLIDGQLILELKSCEALAPVHRAQCITYLGITGLRVALLINFNVPILNDGIKRVVRSY